MNEERGVGHVFIVIGIPATSKIGRNGSIQVLDFAHGMQNGPVKGVDLGIEGLKLRYIGTRFVGQRSEGLKANAFLELDVLGLG
jgi:hypothetical protein